MMTNSHETCPKCNERKHVLNACSRCGFQRNPRKGSLSSNQLKEAAFIVNGAKSERKSISRSQQEPVRNRKTATPKIPAQRRTITGTQLTDSKNDERDIIIGLDFGTACTKVIIRDDIIQKTYAVPFGKLAYEGSPYLIPTRVYAERDGRLSLESGRTALTDLKIKLLGSAEQIMLSNDESAIEATALDICTGYLALVLNEVVRWFLNTNTDVYRKTYLIWQLNIGMPSRSYDDKHQCELFRVLALAAWRAMAEQGPVTIEGVQGAIENSRRDIQKPEHYTDGEMRPEYVEVVPEVIAESVGYARSNLRREGTHLLVDVGAGTLDVAMFMLHAKDDEDHYALLTTEVKQLGAYSLHRQRVIDVEAYIKEQLNKILAVNDGVSPLPPVESYMPIDEDGLREIDIKFRSQCIKLIASSIHETRTRRNSLAKVWETSLPVLLCGGGCHIELYQEALKSAVDGVQQNTMLKFELDLVGLQKPDNLEADELAPGGFYRLAVAYGLSTRRDLIGKVIPPEAIADTPPKGQSKDYRLHFISMEMT